MAQDDFHGRYYRLAVQIKLRRLFKSSTGRPASAPDFPQWAAEQEASLPGGIEPDAQDYYDARHELGR